MDMNLGGWKMKKYIDLIHYHFDIYFKTNKYIMPILVWFVVLVNSYTIKNIEIVSSFMVTAIALNFIMIWLGISYFDSVDVVAEQILLLKVGKRSTYYLSKYYFMILVGIVLSLGGVLFPVFQNAVNGFDMFLRSITVQDVASGFIIHSALATMGLSVAIVFQPMCLKDRKIALLIMSLVSIVGLAKKGIIEQNSIFKYILWVFPPTSKIIELFSDCDYFGGKSVLITAVLGGVYSLVLIVIAQNVIKRKLY